MVNVRTLDVDRSSLGNGAKFLNRCFPPPPLKTLETFSQRIGHDASHGLSCFPGNRLREPVGFGVLYVEIGSSSFLHYFLSFVIVLRSNEFNNLL